MITRKDIRHILKKEGLPHTDMTMNRYERDGIIPTPKRMKIGTRGWRMYTEEEVTEIIDKIKAYKISS